MSRNIKCPECRLTNVVSEEGAGFILCTYCGAEIRIGGEASYRTPVETPPTPDLAGKTATTPVFVTTPPVYDTGGSSSRFSFIPAFTGLLMGLVGGVIAALVTFNLQPKQDIVGAAFEVQRLRLVDSVGRIRSELALSEADGLPVLNFYDSEGEASLTLGVLPGDHPYFALYGDSHVPSLELDVAPNGPRVALRHAQAQESGVYLFTTPSGGAQMSFRNAIGNDRLTLSSEDGTCSLILCDVNGSPLVTLAGTADKEGKLLFLDESEQIRIALSTDKEVASKLLMRGLDGRIRRITP